MLRVIGGEHKGRILKSLPGESTRPPLSKVRAAVANILNDYIFGASVLDAFSGTGSYSIELLSRGAEKALCVDKNPQAVQVIKGNVAGLKLEDRVTVQRDDALKALVTFDRQKIKFDIIIIAPPYFTDLDRRSMNILGSSGLLNTGGIVLLQQHKNEKYRETYGDLKVLKTYLYGETRITTYRNH